MSVSEGAATGASFEEQMAAIHRTEKQYAEEMAWRRGNDARQARGAALEAAIRVVGESHDVDKVISAARFFERFINEIGAVA